MSDSGPERAVEADDADEVLSIGRARLEMAIAALSPTRTIELEDLKFAAGSSDNGFQWPTAIAAMRGVNSDDLGARPMLTINKLPQHIKQITNEALLNPLAGKVVPVDSDADVEVAEIFQGIIRQIESDSDADVAYGTANDNQVTFGEGYFRVITEYVDKKSFDQKIVIKRIRNSFSVYMDPMIQDPVGRDQEWCWIIEDISKDEYDKKYPKATPSATLQAMGVGNTSIAAWVTEKTQRIGEYFYFHIEMGTLHLYPGGVTAFKGTPEDDELMLHFGKYTDKRESEQKKEIRWVKTNGYEILESSVWAGEWIPVFRVIGNEFEIDGELHISGIVRNAKDPQRTYNYWASTEVEMLALAPKAPFIGYAGQFEGFEKNWKTANTKNWPYLEVNPIVDDASQQVLPLPQRAQPAMPQAGIIAAKQAASEDIKETTGQYNASLGMQSNERSGKAILARQNEGDKSTYHYLTNLGRAIRHLTRCLIDLIPKIYDTEERVVQVMGEDGNSKPVRLNTVQPEAVREVQNPHSGAIEKIYNPNVGKYGVIPLSGPSYATKRQEAAEAMAKIIQTNPEMMNKAGDILVENMDWPGAQRLSKRLAKTIPPEIMDDNDDPALKQAQMQIQQLGQQLEQAMGMLQKVETSFEAREIAVKEADAKTRQFDAETKRIATVEGAMSPEQIQEIVINTLHEVLQNGGFEGQMEPQEQPPQLDPNKMMAEESKQQMQAAQHQHEMMLESAKYQMQQTQHDHDAEMSKMQAAQKPPSGEK